MRYFQLNEKYLVGIPSDVAYNKKYSTAVCGMNAFL